ncbi:MAG: tetratricopeptide repeat protein [Anaerolineales bacterium]|nr:tetratricopeptide repeat protein [Anaerolineales bacterium]
MDTERTASFGYWVRRRRKRLDLTQEALARLVGCAAVTIKKIEADERRPSRQVAERLADTLRLAPDERALFLACARGRRSPLGLALEDGPVQADLSPPAPTASPSPLPAQLTSFIGREAELQAIAELLRGDSVRLVTLTGPAGVGKTRLALQAAAELLDDFAGRVQFVGLAALAQADLIAPYLCQAFNVPLPRHKPELETLKTALQPDPWLLLLDNLEHLLAAPDGGSAAGLVAELLSAAPRLKVLATSQQRLRLSGEVELALSPLPLPNQAALRAGGAEAGRLLAQSAAGALFVARAQAARPTVKTDQADAIAIGEICRRLDGLPLAIELAATQTRVWRPAELLARLEGGRLAVLTSGPRDLPARQQTLRRVLDWSHGLLADQEQRLFARLSVFVGGWTREAAQAVAGPAVASAVQPDGDVSEGLSQLTEKSLIWREPEPGARFQMLGTIREYALDRLAAAGLANEARDRHLAYYAGLAQAVEADAYAGRPIAACLEQVTPEMDNMRAALAWGLSGHNAQAAAELAAGMTLVWHMRGQIAEGRRWLEQAAAAVTEPVAARARALTGAAVMAWQQGDYGVAQANCQASLAIWQALGAPSGSADDRGLEFTLHVLGHVLFDQRDYAAAKDLFAQSLALSRRLALEPEITVLIGDLGLVASHLGDTAEARRHYEESVARARKLDDAGTIVDNLIRLGDLARLDDDDERAAACYTEALSLCRATDRHLDLAAALHKLAHLARHRGDCRQAETLLLESLALQREHRNQQGIAECLAALAEVHVARGEAEAGARLFGTAQAILEVIGAPLAPADQVEWERGRRTAQALLGDEAFEAASAAGYAGRTTPADLS